MDGRQGLGRLRPRPLDWVVGGPRYRWERPPALLLPPQTADADALRSLLAPIWSPGLRVLEVCGEAPILHGEALKHRVAEYLCMTSKTSPSVRRELARRGVGLLLGDPAALAACHRDFDVVAWLRERENAALVLEVAEKLLTRDGILAGLAVEGIALAGRSHWTFGAAADLPSGRRAIVARRRAAARAA